MAAEADQGTSTKERPRRLLLRSAADGYAIRSDGQTVIGRKECDIEVRHASVSAQHASIHLLTPEEAASDSSKVAILHDLNSTNGTYASSSEPPVDRVPLEGTRLALGDSLRFGFCPWIYRLEDAPAEGDAMGKTGEEVRCTSSREERRQQQLQFAETSYLGWLTQVREEYAAVRSRAAAEGSPMAHNPSLEELEATCTAFAQRPMSRCASASWASSPFARTCPLRARSTPGKIRPATAVADLATEEEHKEVDTLEGVVPGPADIEEEQERLSGRSWEVSSILRPPLASAADLESVESQLQEALTFLTETLPALAAEIGEQVSGLVFQALLARSSRTLPGHSGRERCSSERLDGVDSDQVARLVVDAEQLVALLRVKIEDDGDLALARTVLEDSIRFFWDLDQCAKWRDISPWELFEEVND